MTELYKPGNYTGNKSRKKKKINNNNNNNKDIELINVSSYSSTDNDNYSSQDENENEIFIKKTSNKHKHKHRHKHRNNKKSKSNISSKKLKSMKRTYLIPTYLHQYDTKANPIEDKRKSKQPFFLFRIAHINYPAYVAISLAISIISYLLVGISMVIGNTLFVFFPTIFIFIIDNILKYKIILLILIVIKEFFAIIFVLTQLYLRLATIWSFLLFGGVLIMNMIFAAVLGLLNVWWVLLILWLLPTFLLIFDVILVFFIRLCGVKVFMYELDKSKGYFRFALFVLSIIIIFNALPFDTYRIPSPIVIITLGILLFLLNTVILKDLFNKRSELAMRGNYIETAFYLFIISMNFMFTFQVFTVTIGATPATNQSIINNMSTFKKSNRQYTVSNKPPKGYSDEEEDDDDDSDKEYETLVMNNAMNLYNNNNNNNNFTVLKKIEKFIMKPLFYLKNNL